MAKLIHNNKTILKNMRVAKNNFSIAKGLMFSTKKKIDKGLCMILPLDEDVKFGAAVTMWFCFSSMNILFINSEYKVVDNIELKPWKLSYIPKDKCLYVIESTPNKFKNIKIGDSVEIKNLN